uniref:ATP synthase F0 subunit 8 n=1 Tax=Lepidocampa weberi TaxID=165470 RepID=U3KTK2_9HEXA|nr:ATP synthase F0 subunit 8 [Lepidocampa weberi]AEV44876.1 ATP synthase F0 subunit 8 [Lepidocampa weberi]
MPQMMPLSWSIIFLLILAAWTFILIIISFLKQQSPSLSLQSHKKTYFSLSW